MDDLSTQWEERTSGVYSREFDDTTTVTVRYDEDLSSRVVFGYEERASSGHQWALSTEESKLTPDQACSILIEEYDDAVANQDPTEDSSITRRDALLGAIDKLRTELDTDQLQTNRPAPVRFFDEQILSTHKCQNRYRKNGHTPSLDPPATDETFHVTWWGSFGQVAGWYCSGCTVSSIDDVDPQFIPMTNEMWDASSRIVSTLVDEFTTAADEVEAFRTYLTDPSQQEWHGAALYGGTEDLVLTADIVDVNLPIDNRTYSLLDTPTIHNRQDREYPWT